MRHHLSKIYQAVQETYLSVTAKPSWQQTNGHLETTSSAQRSHIPVHLTSAQDELRAMFDRVVEDFEASRASLMLKLPAEDCLVISAHKGLDDALNGSQVSLKDSLAGWVVSNRSPLHISQTNLPQGVHAHLRSPELSSSLSVPVLAGDEVLGVLNLAKYTGEHPYTQADLQHLLARAESWDTRPFKMNTIASVGEQAIHPVKAVRHAIAKGWHRLLPLGLATTVGILVGFMLYYLLTALGSSHYWWESITSFRLPLMPEWGVFIGYLMVGLITVIGIRYLSYFHSFFFHWRRYRQLQPVTTNDIRALPHIPFIKVQITTRGTPGSTEVIQRGIRNIAALVAEAPELYGPKLSVEVITESHEQQQLLTREFRDGFQGDVLVLPKAYETPNGTQLKARALHYMVELRRQGFNRRPGKTFIVHYDEESVMEPNELRKLIRYLATTDKRLTEGPIYYPLEYTDTSLLCRTMEANRPVGCFECRAVMEQGVPLHLHGSNLVIDEELENELGWDIGTLEGQPFIAEDYVFGMQAYLKEGPEVFGWHGCAMLEQPPFSFKSAFKQRYRWVLGVLQGMAMMQQMSEFHRLPKRTRWHILWGTRYRILTFALGLPTGAISLLYLLYQAGLVLSGSTFLPLPIPIMIWLILVGFLWLNSVIIGAWYNLASASEMSLTQRWIEGARVLTLTPIAGILESTAAFWAVVNWGVGRREVSWKPTPKTKQADQTINWGMAT